MSLHRRAIRSLAWVFLSLVAWAALAAGVARANELDHVFEEGNRAYAEGRFADALASYQRLLDHGVRDPAVLMNAGNACYRLERFAEARLAWERALRRAPGDRDLGENLGLAVKALGLEALPAPSWPERTFVAVLGVASADGWGLLALAAWLGLNAALGWCWVSDRGRRPAIAVAVLAAAVAIGAAPVAWAFRARIVRPEAVVLGDAAAALSGPTPGATALFTVPVGEKVGVEGASGEWTHVSLPNGWHGWVPSVSLGRVDR